MTDSHTALLVIDVQNDVVADAYRRDETIAAIAGLVDSARATGIPVVWVQHHDDELVEGTAGWALVDELAPDAGEPLVHKSYRSAFEETELDDVLESLGADSVVLCGAQTNFCVRHTLHAALERGYDVVVAADAHTTSDIEWDGQRTEAAAVIADLNLTYAGYDLPGRSCRVRPAATALIAEPRES